MLLNAIIGFSIMAFFIQYIFLSYLTFITLHSHFALLLIIFAASPPFLVFFLFFSDSSLVGVGYMNMGEHLFLFFT